MLEARAAHPGSQLLGGGTDLIVNLRRGIVAPPVLIDMNGVAELRTIEADARRPRDRRVRDAGRGGAPSRRAGALSRGGAGGGLHRRAHASQHGHRRRQPLPRHALHLLQPERMVALRQQSLPQDHGRHVPRGAEEPRRVLRHLQRRPGARPDDARRRGRPRRARRAGARCRCSNSTSATRATTARPRATASTTWRCSRARSSSACAPSYTPGLRSAYDKIRIRRSIEYPVAGVAVALRREGDTLADLRVAITGTNPRPVLLEGTQRAVRRPARRARLRGPRRSWCATRSCR